MNNAEFALLLVQEVVDSNPPDSNGFLSENGINYTDLKDADEIWKAFVRYNIDAYGIKSGIVQKYWNLLPNQSLIKQRISLLDKIEKLYDYKCYDNFTRDCPVTYAGGSFFQCDKCYDKSSVLDCPVVQLTMELKWHRAHYRIAKILVEDAKRLLIEDENGTINRNLNEVINGIFEKYSEDEEGRKSATEELLKKFENIKGYGNPPKVITWFFSEMSSPVHQIKHWPNLDLRKLSPVDTHVQRLMVRFGFIEAKDVSNKNIEKKLAILYPEEPRKLDYGLYRLAADLEEGICGKNPNCNLCKEKHPHLFQNCSAKII